MIMAFVWFDIECRYFITTCSSLSPGAPYSQTRWCLIDTYANTLAVMIELNLQQPEI